MLLYALALIVAEPTPLTDVHKRDIACVVEIAVMAEQQKRGGVATSEAAQNGKRWAGLVGARIVMESGQPRELVAFAMNEAAKKRAENDGPIDAGATCLQQMRSELAAADAANAPLPKPEKSK
jgi:hypothetical protein